MHCKKLVAAAVAPVDLVNWLEILVTRRASCDL